MVLKKNNPIGFIFLLMLTLNACSSNADESKSVEKKSKDTLILAPQQKDTLSTLLKDSIDKRPFKNQTKNISVNKKANKPFGTLDYNKVVAYDYEGRIGERVLDIITEGKLASTIKQQKELTQEQVESLTNCLGSDSTYGGGKAFCFEPHLGIVFYKNRKIVAHVSICLECNHLSSSIKIPATELKKIKIGDDFEYPAEGFSKEGRLYLSSFCEALKFSHCVSGRKE